LETLDFLLAVDEFLLEKVELVGVGLFRLGKVVITLLIIMFSMCAVNSFIDSGSGLLASTGGLESDAAVEV
jgi:hypothetical protein